MNKMFEIGNFVESKCNKTGIVIEDNLLFCAIKCGRRFNIKVKFYNGVIDYYDWCGHNYSASDEMYKI